jgi:hypothetical protein
MKVNSIKTHKNIWLKAKINFNYWIGSGASLSGLGREQKVFKVTIKVRTGIYFNPGLL